MEEESEGMYERTQRAKFIGKQIWCNLSLTLSPFLLSCLCSLQLSPPFDVCPVFGYVTDDSLSVLDDIQIVKCKNKKPVIPVKMSE